MTDERQHLSFTEIKALPSKEEEVRGLRAYVARMETLGVDTQVVRKAQKRLKALTTQTASSKSPEKVSTKQEKSEGKLARERKRSKKGKGSENG